MSVPFDPHLYFSSGVYEQFRCPDHAHLYTEYKPEFIDRMALQKATNSIHSTPWDNLMCELWMVNVDQRDQFLLNYGSALHRSEFHRHDIVMCEWRNKSNTWALFGAFNNDEAHLEDMVFLPDSCYWLTSLPFGNSFWQILNDLRYSIEKPGFSFADALDLIVETRKPSAQSVNAFLCEILQLTPDGENMDRVSYAAIEESIARIQAHTLRLAAGEQPLRSSTRKM